MGEASNKIIGKLKVGSDTLATLEGHWDQDIYIRDRSTGVCAYLCLCSTLTLNDGNKGITVYIRYRQRLSFCLQESHLFWSPTAEVKAQRLRRFTVPVDHQEDMESERYGEAVFEG